MARHAFHLPSFIVGLAVLVLGVVVACSGLDRVSDHAVVWLAIAAAVLGLSLLPWRCGRPSPPVSPPSP